MKNSGKAFIYILVLVSVLLSACSAGSAASPTPEGTLAPVRSENRLFAEGTIVPVQYASINFTAVGTVVEILVKEGETVKKDQTIARLDGKERLEAAIAAAELSMVSAKNSIDELYRNADVDRANAQLALARAESALDDAQEERDRKQYRRGTQEKIDVAFANYEAYKDEAEEAEDEYLPIADRAPDDPARAYALNRLIYARDKRDHALWEYNWLNAKPDALEVAEADGTLAVAKASVDAAKKKLERVKDGPDTELLALANATLKNAEAQLVSAKRTLADLDLRAPFDGVVVTNDLKIGELAGSGLPSAVSVADLSLMQVKTTDLTELNVIDITPGMSVKISLDAIPGEEFTGTVTRINALGENKQGDITYTVIITLDKQDPRLKWNMTTQVVFEK